MAKLIIKKRPSKNGGFFFDLLIRESTISGIEVDLSGRDLESLPEGQILQLLKSINSVKVIEEATAGASSNAIIKSDSLKLFSSSSYK